MTNLLLKYLQFIENKDESLYIPRAKLDLTGNYIGVTD